MHGLLNWKIALPYLQAAAGSTLSGPTAAPAPGQGPDWDEARREGCESPLVLRLLRALRDSGLPEPLKQFVVANDQGRVITRADFAYQEPRRPPRNSENLCHLGSSGTRLHDPWPPLKIPRAFAHGQAAEGEFGAPGEEERTKNTPRSPQSSSTMDNDWLLSQS